MQLPWKQDSSPLMLAPLQGLTNASMRGVQMEIGAPDVLFSEFVQVSRVSRRRLSRRDLEEVSSHCLAAPLVVQLVGNSPEALMESACILQDNGVQHLNLNLGCPYGRMTSGNTGGGMLKDEHHVERCLKAIRAVVQGSFSVKVRSGYDEHGQILGLLPVFEACGVDYIILHPRTVIQKYTGIADHALTARVVDVAKVPVVANGDITTAKQGRKILAETKAAGLMLGRGAISDPGLFRRIRKSCAGFNGDSYNAATRRAEIRVYLLRLLDAYNRVYSGEQQVLAKMKNVVQFIEDESLRRWRGKVKRTGTLRSFVARVETLPEEPG